MLNLLRSEWYKLRRHRSFWLLLSVLFLSAAAYVLLNYFDDPDDDGALTERTGLDMLAAAMGGNNYIIKIGLSMLAGFFISSEYSTGTIKRAVASGYSRSRFVTAKLLLATMDVTREWTGRAQNWGQMLLQLSVFFPDRIGRHLR